MKNHYQPLLHYSVSSVFSLTQSGCFQIFTSSQLLNISILMCPERNFLHDSCAWGFLKISGSIGFIIWQIFQQVFLEMLFLSWPLPSFLFRILISQALGHLKLFCSSLILCSLLSRLISLCIMLDHFYCNVFNSFIFSSVVSNLLLISSHAYISDHVFCLISASVMGPLLHMFVS